LRSEAGEPAGALVVVRDHLDGQRRLRRCDRGEEVVCTGAVALALEVFELEGALGGLAGRELDVFG
jgi:hypothetical protein